MNSKVRVSFLELDEKKQNNVKNIFESLKLKNCLIEFRSSTEISYQSEFVVLDSQDNFFEIQEEDLKSNLAIIFYVEDVNFFESFKRDLINHIHSSSNKIHFFFDDNTGFNQLNLMSFIKAHIREARHGVDVEELTALHKLIEVSQKQLKKIKQIHEKIVPMRSDKIKGLSLLSKFGAGVSPGGEFFDIVKGSSECLILMSSSTSYVTSSVVLSHFEPFQSKNSFALQEIEDYLTEIYHDFSQKGLSLENSDCQILMLRVDLAKLILEGHIFGHFDLRSSHHEIFKGNDLDFNPVFFEKSYIKHRLGRNERCGFFSPGVLLNLQKSFQGPNKDNFLKKIMTYTGREMINEAFFQMNSVVEGAFLDYDATILSIEVDNNVIVQV